MWTNPYSASSSSTFSTLVCKVSVCPGRMSAFRTTSVRMPLVGEGHGRVAYDGHDLVPVALDLGEHGGGAVGQAGVADDADGLGHIGRELVSHAEGRDGNGNKGVHEGGLSLWLQMRLRGLRAYR